MADKTNEVIPAVNWEERFQSEFDARVKLEKEFDNLTKENAKLSKKIAKKKEGESFLFRKGTVLKLGEQKITLIADSEVFFEGAKNEQLMVGILTLSGNLDINRPSLAKTYNDLGLEVE